MPWFYKIEMHYREFKFHMDTEFTDYLKKFIPFRILYIYKADEDQCYVFADKDLYPPNMVWAFKDSIHPIGDQEEANKLALNINRYQYDGDYSLLGSLGELPIQGNQN